MLLLWILFVTCGSWLSVPCSLVVTCSKRTDLVALLYVMFSCGFGTFPYGILGQVWCLIVSIPDLRPLSFFQYRSSLNGGQKYRRTLQGEHSAILSTSIKLPFAIKTLVLSIFKWRLKTGFTVIRIKALALVVPEIFFCFHYITQCETCDPLARKGPFFHTFII